MIVTLVALCESGCSDIVGNQNVVRSTVDQTVHFVVFYEHSSAIQSCLSSDQSKGTISSNFTEKPGSICSPEE